MLTGRLSDEVHLAAALPREVRGAALRELGGPTGCGCCDSLLDHVRIRLGSTLFLDDDPRRLVEAFPPGERRFITPRVLAACILLTGRERVSLYPAERPAEWPALRLLAKAR